MEDSANWDTGIAVDWDGVTLPSVDTYGVLTVPVEDTRGTDSLIGCVVDTEECYYGVEFEHNATDPSTVTVDFNVGQMTDGTSCTYSEAEEYGELFIAIVEDTADYNSSVTYVPETVGTTQPLFVGIIGNTEGVVN